MFTKWMKARRSMYRASYRRVALTDDDAEEEAFLDEITGGLAIHRPSRHSRRTRTKEASNACCYALVALAVVAVALFVMSKKLHWFEESDSQNRMLRSLSI
mmetsp:Transcript_711/g.2013  ORF Transcript_711/g.2013 Transcript_711/m.2013 type:complete len:101 (-) Transcript_711:1663-1965(-)